MDDPGGQRIGLAPITLADKPQFDRVLSALAHPISDYSFANTYVWSTSFKLFHARIARHLCVFANGTGDLTMLKPPLPERGASEADLRECITHCFDIMDAYNDVHARRAHSRIEYVSDEMLERLQSATLRSINLSATPMHGDYVYDTQRMIDLAGGALKSKRHARSRFVRDYPDHHVEDLDEAHVPACLDLLALWERHGDAAHEGEVNEHHIGSDILRRFDTRACELALDSWRELGLTGMALFVGDRLIGFTLGEAISPMQASILIEKTHPAFSGAAQFIFSEFCRRHWASHPECNAGDDWGIPSLRFTKQSYRPVRLLSKYTLTRQPVVVVCPPAINMPIENPKFQIAADADGIEIVPLMSEAPVKLRPALKRDVSAILHLERACFTSAEETFNRRQIRYLIGDPRATVTVAVRCGRVIGWAVGLVRQHRRSRSGRLYAVAVHPDAQGRHLGRRLVEHTLAALAGLGIERIFLEVRSDNTPAISLYRKMGFADHRELPNYYGEWAHGKRMKLAAPALSRVIPARVVADDPEPTLFDRLPAEAVSRPSPVPNGGRT
jgi:ribosomal-protein-alanine N-acetyltransferase